MLAVVKLCVIDAVLKPRELNVVSTLSARSQSTIVPVYELRVTVTEPDPQMDVTLGVAVPPTAVLGLTVTDIVLLPNGAHGLLVTRTLIE